MITQVSKQKTKRKNNKTNEQSTKPKEIIINAWTNNKTKRNNNKTNEQPTKQKEGIIKPMSNQQN